MNKTTLTIIILITLSFSTMAQDAKEIVRNAEEKFNGEKSSYSEMVMTIVRPAYTREIEFKNWVQESEESLTLITAPAKEKGQTFLKSGDNMWNWNPTIQRLIKLPPSMMSQGWMGSDYSNDDILNESSLVSDFTHKITGNETIDGYECHKIELTPLENADIVWGKIIMWISKNEYLNFRAEYYDEAQYLVKTHLSRNVKSFDERQLPSIMEIIPEDEEGQKTLVEIKEMEFNIELEENFFSQQNMKRIR
ncbi:MAG: outer membrane lipoprotein-sorting protein [Prolixibacteraceae bacterium]|jgi:outer membrane lipoprotein-sorting protein|nr:outer membrane lipoprotein-sorting protein [Prolixibacteraceae bacterium]